MPELRRDPLTGRWVSYAPERAKRPVEMGEKAPPLVDDPGKCPFCPGKEHILMPAVIVLTRSDSGLKFLKEEGDERVKDWIVKIIPNLYPAFTVNDTIKMGEEMKEARGHHEVMIDTPQHDADPWKMTVDQIYFSLLTVRERLKELESYQYVKFAGFGKNHGPNSGGSLRHPHTHVFATPITPEIIEIEAKRLRKDKCLLCDWVKEVSGSRGIISTENFMAICPWASREPYEILIAPKDHLRRFIDLDDRRLTELSSILSTIYKALNMVLDNPSFNLVLHTAAKDVNDFHWHFELIPRILMPMVVDIGIGIHVNTVYPEKAAEDLRAAIEKL